MKIVLVVCVFISLSIAFPTAENANAEILSYENNNNAEGNYEYEFSFETSNGISREESGRLVNFGEPNEHLEVQGVYSYTDTEGKVIVVLYTADDNGYNVQEGASLLPLLPPSPSLPPALVATLLGE